MTRRVEHRATREDARRTEIDAAFRAFVGDSKFSCLAGKGVVRTDRYDLGVYGALGSARSARMLARDLTAFVAAPDVSDSAFRSLIAVFPTRAPRDEMDFERRLWTQLQMLHEQDAPDSVWDPAVADDPDDPHFAFSFGGCGFFVIGMHPRSSRDARRFGWPALVFNPHAQFEHLRDTGRFDRLRDIVRDREIALQGSLNPNLADFGEQSEARQYSGRAVDREWACPFHRRPA
jgi:FPC/CPF motif-containing protein YcgG